MNFTTQITYEIIQDAVQYTLSSNFFTNKDTLDFQHLFISDISFSSPLK